MSDHQPLSRQQVQQLRTDVENLAERAEGITNLLLAGYGPEDSRVGRAQDIRDAIQRLKWAIERSKNADT